MRNVFRGRFVGQDWWVSRNNEVACLFPDEKDCRYYHRLGGDDAVRFMAAKGTWIVPQEMVEVLPDPDRVAEGPRIVFTSRGEWEDVNAKTWERFRVLEHELTGLAASVDRLIDRVDALEASPRALPLPPVKWDRHGVRWVPAWEDGRLMWGSDGAEVQMTLTHRELVERGPFTEEGDDE